MCCITKVEIDIVRSLELACAISFEGILNYDSAILLRASCFTPPDQKTLSQHTQMIWEVRIGSSG